MTAKKITEAVSTIILFVGFVTVAFADGDVNKKTKSAKKSKIRSEGTINKKEDKIDITNSVSIVNKVLRDFPIGKIINEKYYIYKNGENTWRGIIGNTKVEITSCDPNKIITNVRIENNGDKYDEMLLFVKNDHLKKTPKLNETRYENVYGDNSKKVAETVDRNAEWDVTGNSRIDLQFRGEINYIKSSGQIVNEPAKTVLQNSIVSFAPCH